VFLRVDRLSGRALAGDRADEALPEPQLGQVDGVRVQTLGGVEFEDRIGAQHVEGADFGDHVEAISRTIRQAAPAAPAAPA